MYYLQERATIGEFKSKKEALQDKDNHEMWYPENNYYVVNEEGESVTQTKEQALRQIVGLMNQFEIKLQNFIDEYNRLTKEAK
jgi:hypothetical protein